MNKIYENTGAPDTIGPKITAVKQAELMIYWCASVLDTGDLGTTESSMAKVAVSEALMRVADNCVQVMGGTGVTDQTIVEQMIRTSFACSSLLAPSGSLRAGSGDPLPEPWVAPEPGDEDWEAVEYEDALDGPPPTLAQRHPSGHRRSRRSNSRGPRLTRNSYLNNCSSFRGKRL